MYDVTNFYFKIDEADEFRRLGLSKEKRRDPMGLAVDGDGIPLHYELFPSNTLEKGRNFNGYVFSFSVRGGTKAFKEFILYNEGYLDKDGRPADENTDSRVKDRVIARDVNVILPSGKKTKKTVYEKQVVFGGRKYALKAKAERAEVLKRAHQLISNPQKYTKAISYDAAKYVKNLKFDKKSVWSLR